MGQQVAQLYDRYDDDDDDYDDDDDDDKYTQVQVLKDFPYKFDVFLSFPSLSWLIHFLPFLKLVSKGWRV
jgi:hypothetical protein